MMSLLFLTSAARAQVPLCQLSGVSRKQLEALVDAGCLEVVALGVASGLRAEVLLRLDIINDIQNIISYFLG